MWATYLSVGLASALVQVIVFVIGQYTGDSAAFVGEFDIWPQTLAGWGLTVAYWFINLALFWILIAAVAKRLRECGVAFKWLVVFATLFILTGKAMEWLTGNAETIPSWQFGMAMIAMLPVCLMGLWLFGLAFFASSPKPHSFDPSQLPEGWKT